MGGTVYDIWRNSKSEGNDHRPSNAPADGEARVGDLGSGSDFTPFLQHVGVPSTDVGSGGPYGVYHSVFDNFAWFKLNADPQFSYLQEMARIFGLESLRMADADVLPYDYVNYAREISSYLDTAKRKAGDQKLTSLDFAAAQAAAARFAAAAQKVRGLQSSPGASAPELNRALRQAEAALVSPAGLPNRPWYRHTIYAPGEYTGYAAVVIPGVNEALDAKDGNRAAQQLTVLTQALDHAAQALDSAR
jgi:N-acetylated-alpha-linked acidic dipeptidase